MPQLGADGEASPGLDVPARGHDYPGFAYASPGKRYVIIQPLLTGPDEQWSAAGSGFYRFFARLLIDRFPGPGTPPRFFPRDFQAERPTVCDSLPGWIKPGQFPHLYAPRNEQASARLPPPSLFPSPSDARPGSSAASPWADRLQYRPDGLDDALRRHTGADGECRMARARL